MVKSSHLFIKLSVLLYDDNLSFLFSSNISRPVANFGFYVFIKSGYNIILFI